MYSFYELFAHYAKHLERCISTIDPSEREHYCSEFHDILMLSIGSIAEGRLQSPSPDHILNGEQLERMISALVTAEQECSAEHTLKHILNRFNFPNYMYAPQPEDYPSEYEIYKQCFMLENGDLK